MKEQENRDDLISVIIPTFNEADNIRELVPLIHRILGTQENYEYEIIIVDDNSSDGTWQAAKELSATYPVRVIRRWGKLGLASAVIVGFYNAEGDVLVCMDADFQHAPEVIPQLIKAIKNGSDIAIGSRYISEGRIDNWQVLRRLMSRFSSLMAKLLTDVKDPMSGFFAIKKELIEEIKEFDPVGYKILLEILVKVGTRKGIRVMEVPIIFKLRKFGKSKLDLGEIIRYGVLLSKLMMWKLKARVSRPTCRRTSL